MFYYYSFSSPIIIKKNSEKILFSKEQQKKNYTILKGHIRVERLKTFKERTKIEKSHFLNPVSSF